MGDTSPWKYIVITILVLMIALSGGLVFVLYLRKKRKAREAARQKLLEEQTRQVSYDSTSPEYRNLYKKALLKASQDESVASSSPSKRSNYSVDLEAQTAGLSTARSSGGASGASPRPDLEDSEIFSVAIGSWYEHLIRHSATEYLRAMVKQQPGISERDLVPEMRILLEHCPTVPLVRWSKLSADEKALISKKARDLKDLIVANVQRRFPKSNRVAA